MKRWFNTVFQGIATGAQIVNLYSPFLPPRYQTILAGVLAATQGGVAVVAHKYNPDGTPAALPYQPRK